MPFPVPPATSITLPTGATSGARIVIDGSTNKITIYDANNVAVIVIAASFTQGAVTTGPVVALIPDTTPAASPFTLPGFFDVDYDSGTHQGSVELSSPSVDPGQVNQSHLQLYSGTAANNGADSQAKLIAGSQGVSELVAGTVLLEPTSDLYPTAIDSDGNTHDVPAGEWHTVNVTVTAGNSAGTAVLTFTRTYTSAAPKVIATINSGSGNAIRATVFVSTKTPTQCTIRVDTNAALGATTKFPVDVLVLTP